MALTTLEFALRPCILSRKLTLVLLLIGADLAFHGRRINTGDFRQSNAVLKTRDIAAPPTPGLPLPINGYNPSSSSANLLTPSRALDNLLFKFGPANQLDGIISTGQTINLPPGHYIQLLLLATGVQGGQTSQTIIVTYEDRTSS